MSDSDPATCLPATPDAVVTATGRHLARLLSQPLKSGLYLIATPIGNLGDITLRAIAILAQCDVVYCEDTRRSRILLDQFGLRTRLRVYEEHTAERERPQMLARLAHGDRIGLISDAGTPLVSDPGYKLVRDAVAQGVPVVAIPGASAVLTALTIAGLPTDTFHFAGFLPPKSAARRTRLAALADVPGTLVLFETAPRLAALLADAAEVLGGERPAVVARELTKLHEDARRGQLAELAREVGEPIGEIVVVIGRPTGPDVVDDAVILGRLAHVMADHSIKDSARLVAEELAVSKSRVYGLALTLKRGTTEPEGGA